jgi:hypothetical protein
MLCCGKHSWLLRSAIHRSSWKSEETLAVAVVPVFSVGCVSPTQIPTRFINSMVLKKRVSIREESRSQTLGDTQPTENTSTTAT